MTELTKQRKEPALFRRKEAETWAMQFDGTSSGAVEAERFMQVRWAGLTICDQSYWIHLQTPEGEIRIDPGDWIIRRGGEFYPVKPDIFAQDYEPVEAGRSSLESENAELRDRVGKLRFKLYYYAPFEGQSHTTACSIWREDGQGHAEGFDGDMGPCNCGALINFWKARAEKAESENARLREAMEATELNQERLVSAVMAALHDMRLRCSVDAALEWFQQAYREAIEKLRTADEQAVFAARKDTPTLTGR